MKLNLKNMKDLKKKEKFNIFLWSIFDRKKYLEYDKFLKLGLTKRAVYFHVKNSIK